MAPPGVDVAVVIVTHQSADHLPCLLGSLPEAMSGTDYRVVVVDNGSTDDSAGVAERAGVEVYREHNRGFAAGVNRGIAAAPDARCYLVVNPDATLDARSGARLLAVMRRRRAGIVAPRVRESDGALSTSLRREPTVARVGGLSFTGLSIFAERIDDPHRYRTEREVDWVMGAVMLIDGDCYRDVGGFCEEYFLYSEETEFCLQARERGWSTVYTPWAGAMHIGGGSGTSIRTHTMQMINRVRLVRRRRGRRHAWCYLAGSVLVELRRSAGDRQHWATVRALLDPSVRPPELGAGEEVLP